MYAVNEIIYTIFIIRIFYIRVISLPYCHVIITCSSSKIEYYLSLKYIPAQ